jgi:hypothetical protein
MKRPYLIFWLAIWAWAMIMGRGCGVLKFIVSSLRQLSSISHGLTVDSSTHLNDMVSIRSIIIMVRLTDSSRDYVTRYNYCIFLARFP